jgi:hypothetical protein
MAEVKIVIPDDLKKDFEAVSKAALSVAVFRLMKEEIERLARVKAIVSKSTLTEKDVNDLSEKVDASLSKKIRQAS